MQAKLVAIIGCLFAVAGLTMAQAPEAPQPIQFGELQPFAQWDAGDEFVTSFPTAVPTGQEKNDEVPIHILLPRDRRGPVPVVVILHYWGALNRNVERGMAQELNKKGIAALLMTLPYHLDRTPPGSRSGELAIQADPERLKLTMLQSLQDTRRAIDFLVSRPEFDHEKIGVAGLSLGAIVASLVYGVDTRTTHAVFVLGGVDVAHILWHSSRVVPQRDDLRRKGYTEAKLRQELEPLEPTGFLKARPETDALIVAARYDTVIPPKSTQELIDAIAHPTVSWLETGHFGGAFVQRKLLTQTAEYFDSRFSGREFSPAHLAAPTIRLGVQYNLNTGMDIGFGADLWSGGPRRSITATGLLTPRGARLFLGQRVGRQLSAGALLDGRRISVGVLWSTVL